MLSYFVFDGASCASVDMYVTDAGIDEVPERDISEIEIPGRNGTLVIDNKRHRNVIIEYPAVIINNFRDNYDALKQILLTKGSNYYELWDGFTPNTFRMARFSAITGMKQTIHADKATFRVVFDCKPQRYLVTGKTRLTFTEDGVINNPTAYASKPLLRVYGDGVIGIGDTTMQITYSNSYIDIDCETMECYKESANRSAYVINRGIDFPSLTPGSNNITLGTGISKIEVVPRWYVL